MPLWHAVILKPLNTGIELSLVALAHSDIRIDSAVPVGLSQVGIA